MSKSKARVLSCVLAFVLLCLPAFCLSVSAAEAVDGAPDYSAAPNLIDPSQWIYYGIYPEGASVNYTYFPNPDIIRFWSVGASNGIIGAELTETQFISGHNYLVTFTVEQANYPFRDDENFGVFITEGLDFQNSYKSFEIQGSEFSVGRSFSFSFTGEDYKDPHFALVFQTNHGFDFRLQNLRVVDTTLADQDRQTSTIGGFISDLGTSLLDGIKGFFVPSEDAIIDFKDTCSDLFSDHLGFLYDIGTIVSTSIETIGDILDAASSDSRGYITMPEMEFTFLGYTVHLWDETTIDFEFLDDIPSLSLLYNLYALMLNLILIVILIRYAQRIYKELFMV